MRWKKEFSLNEEKGHWYLKNNHTGEFISIEDEHIPLVTAIYQGIEDEDDMIRYLLKETKQGEVVINCLLASFFIQYGEYMNVDADQEIRIEA